MCLAPLKDCFDIAMAAQMSLYTTVGSIVGMLPLFKKRLNDVHKLGRDCEGFILRLWESPFKMDRVEQRSYPMHVTDGAGWAHRKLVAFWLL